MKLSIGQCTGGAAYHVACRLETCYVAELRPRKPFHRFSGQLKADGLPKELLGGGEGVRVLWHDVDGMP